jgi:hypothetical protein
MGRRASWLCPPAALRHLDRYCFSHLDWAQHGAAHMRGTARLVAAHAASLHTLNVDFRIPPKP